MLPYKKGNSMEYKYEIINDIDKSIVASYDNIDDATYELNKAKFEYFETIKKIYLKIEGIRIKIFHSNDLTSDELKLSTYKPTTLMQAIVTNNLRIVETPRIPSSIVIDFGDVDLNSSLIKNKTRGDEYLWVIALSKIVKTGHYKESRTFDEWHKLLIEEAVDPEMGPEIEVAEEDREAYERIVTLMEESITPNSKQEKMSRGGRWRKRQNRA